MYLQYGSYRHASGENEVTITRERKRQGNTDGYTERWTINGLLMGSNPDDLTGKIRQLENAYAFDRGNLGLFKDDGTPTAHVIYSASTFSGTRIAVPVSFPKGGGDEYTNYRTYQVQVEADFVLSATSDTGILAYTESLSHEGGGPLDIFLQGVYYAQKQRVALATPYRLIQEGSAIGRFGYPPPNPPLFPADVHWPQAKITRKAPKREGPPGYPTYAEFEVTWYYVMEAVNPFFAYPTPQAP